MKFDHYEYTIGAHFLPALINDDYTLLTDQDEIDFGAWLNANNMRGSHWTIEDDSERFATCEISGLGNQCAIVRQYFPMRG
jgi:hypothetical protein